ncbi:MAG: hypothetical protein HZB76_04745 [Chlamydiae bacterium]|nr:hypothetical protein [Chlamydiota bacterium]
MKLKEKIKKAQIKNCLLKNYSKEAVEILNWLESGNKYLDFLCDSLFICSKKDEDFYEKMSLIEALYYMLSAHEKASNRHQELIRRLKNEITRIKQETAMDQNEKFFVLFKVAKNKEAFYDMLHKK